MKKQLLFWIPTALLLFFMVGSGVYYFVDTPAAALAFTQLGYPTYTLYFNATAKILGGIAIVAPVPRMLNRVGVCRISLHPSPRATGCGHDHAGCSLPYACIRCDLGMGLLAV